MVLRLGVELEAASDGADFDAAVLGAVAANHFVERGADDVFFFADGARDLVERGGLVGGVDDGFERAF